MAENRITRIRTVRVFGTTLEVHLCSTGQRFHAIWAVLVESHAPSEEIYQAMCDYFQHRNGIRGQDGQMAIAACWHCFSRYPDIKPAEGTTGESTLPRTTPTADLLQGVESSGMP